VVTIHTTSLTFSNSTFCPHSSFMCFVWIWEQTAIISLYNINWLVFITKMKSVYCAVRTASLNKAVCASSLKGKCIRRFPTRIIFLHCVISVPITRTDTSGSAPLLSFSGPYFSPSLYSQNSLTPHFTHKMKHKFVLLYTVTGGPSNRTRWLEDKSPIHITKISPVQNE
jgi:hypothetical protein